ncbi:unnamed protein product [Paramecium pentaurelia]|uniref:C2H2-type domain-containing protein n=1 Tax=Paramecium pentaurelia TaxID=43138 RepID=A0A8S1XBC0_9CILI|nr:unnamed protein product [Paramecium pentaurelia]
MQYVPLTTHLNALAQLYLQCASLSERCDKLARGEEIINEDKQIQNHKDQGTIEIDCGPAVLQTQEGNKQRHIESRSNTPIEINIVDEEEEEIERKNDNPISNQTKKIKRAQIQQETKQQQIQCSQCKQLFKNHKQMKKHFDRAHNTKSVKKVNKKLQQEFMVQL